MKEISLDKISLAKGKKSLLGIDDAIKIVDSDRYLKDSLFFYGKEKLNLLYGLILFDKFKYTLVEYENRLAWYIVVTGGDWGAQTYIKKPNSKSIIDHLVCSDGYFDESSHISCLLFIDNKEYRYLNVLLEDKEIVDSLVEYEK